MSFITSITDLPAPQLASLENWLRLGVSIKRAAALLTSAFDSWLPLKVVTQYCQSILPQLSTLNSQPAGSAFDLVKNWALDFARERRPDTGLLRALFSILLKLEALNLEKQRVDLAAKAGEPLPPPDYKRPFTTEEARAIIAQVEDIDLPEFHTQPFPYTPVDYEI